MNTQKMVRIAMIAAIYTAICFVPGLSMIAFGQIQVRIAEALTLLPLLDKRAIAGVTLGCFLTNLLGAMLGINPTIRLVAPKSIVRSEGKAVRVIDNRKKIGINV